MTRLAMTRTARFLGHSKTVFASSMLVFGSVLCTACSTDSPGPQSVSNEKIIVSGASGQLGGLVVEELLARGVSPGNLILVNKSYHLLSEDIEDRQIYF